MKTESYKNIKFSVNQLAVGIVAFEQFISKEEKDIVFFTEKLNGSNNIKEVEQFDSQIKSSRERVKEFKSLIGQMVDDNNEFIIKHQL
mgnify:CR=1 FL=1|tara:strand:- start:1151 stop:1414 length:264 start_codon:yes stop_codon:yes gene_type:complete